MWDTIAVFLLLDVWALIYFYISIIDITNNNLIVTTNDVVDIEFKRRSGTSLIYVVKFSINL
jgi:hypothetical protein